MFASIEKVDHRQNRIPAFHSTNEKLEDGENNMEGAGFLVRPADCRKTELEPRQSASVTIEAVCSFSTFWVLFRPFPTLNSADERLPSARVLPWTQKCSCQVPDQVPSLPTQNQSMHSHGQSAPAGKHLADAAFPGGQSEISTEHAWIKW